MNHLHFRSPEETIETLRLATEAADVGIWDLNVASGELHWTEITKRIFGLTAEGSLSLADFTQLVHPDDRALVSAAVEGALSPEGSGEYDIDYRIVRPNGEERSVAARGKAFFELLRKSALPCDSPVRCLTEPIRNDPKRLFFKRSSWLRLAGWPLPSLTRSTTT